MQKQLLQSVRSNRRANASININICSTKHCRLAPVVCMSHTKWLLAPVWLQSFWVKLSSHQVLLLQPQLASFPLLICSKDSEIIATHPEEYTLWFGACVLKETMHCELKLKDKKWLLLQKVLSSRLNAKHWALPCCSIQYFGAYSQQKLTSTNFQIGEQL